MFKNFLFTILLLSCMFICGCGSDNYNIFRRIAKTTATTKSSISEGQTALANGDYDQAKEIFKQIIDRSPGDSKAIEGYVAAVMRTPELLYQLLEASHEFEDGRNKTIDVNKYKFISIDRVHELKEDIVDQLLENPAVVKTMSSEPNVNTVATFAMAALVTIADNSNIKEILGIGGNNVGFNDIKNLPAPDIIKAMPEAMDAIHRADRFLDFAQASISKIVNEKEKRIFTQEVLAKVQDVKDQLSKYKNQ
jgi:hypothetical protein